LVRAKNLSSNKGRGTTKRTKKCGKTIIISVREVKAHKRNVDAKKIKRNFRRVPGKSSTVRHQREEKEEPGVSSTNRGKKEDWTKMFIRKTLAMGKTERRSGKKEGKERGNARNKV